jgi:hypothetical protein
MRRTYQITVRGPIPANLVDIISARHALAYLQTKNNRTDEGNIFIPLIFSKGIRPLIYPGVYIVSTFSAHRFPYESALIVILFNLNNGMTGGRNTCAASLSAPFRRLWRFMRNELEGLFKYKTLENIRKRDDLMLKDGGHGPELHENLQGAPEAR